VEGSGTLIDPLVPDEGIKWFDDRGIERVVLSNRHHLRHAELFADRYGCPILCHEAGMHEFAGGPEVEAYAPGDRLAPDVLALEMDAICPDDSVLAIDAGGAEALLFADSIINYGEVGFVPDGLIGENPDEVKRQVRARAAELCEREPDHLLFAHGDPVIGEGSGVLRSFAAG
jgi:hypothetical protein